MHKLKTKKAPGFVHVGSLVWLTGALDRTEPKLVPPCAFLGMTEHTTWSNPASMQYGSHTLLMCKSS